VGVVSNLLKGSRDPSSGHRKDEFAGSNSRDYMEA